MHISDKDSISKVQNLLDEIYSSANSRISAEDILLRLSENLALTFDVLGHNRDSENLFAKALSWLFAYCRVLDVDLQDTVIERYPNVCPHCILNPCQCNLTNKLPYGSTIPLYQRNSELAQHAMVLRNAINLNKNGIFSLDDASDMLDSIYPNNGSIFMINPYFFSAKLSRESGKIINSFRKFRSSSDSSSSPYIRKQIEKDIADVFAWTIGFWRLRIIDTGNTSIQIEFVKGIKLDAHIAMPYLVHVLRKSVLGIERN